MYLDYPARHVVTKKTVTDICDFSDEEVKTLTYKDSAFWKEIETATEYIKTESFCKFDLGNMIFWNQFTAIQMESEIGHLIRQDRQSKKYAQLERKVLENLYQVADSYVNENRNIVSEQEITEFVEVCKKTDEDIENELVGTVAWGDVLISGRNPLFTINLALAKIDVKEIYYALQREPEKRKKHWCYHSEGICDIWLNAKTGMLEGIYPLLPNSERRAIVKNSYCDFLKKYIRNIKKKIERKSANEILHEVGFLLQKRGMVRGEERRNYFGYELYEMYMNIYFRTLGMEEAAKELAEMRNDLLTQAIDTLANAKIRRGFRREQGYLDFEEQIAEKMDIKGISREDAIWEIHRRYHKTTGVF